MSDRRRNPALRAVLGATASIEQPLAYPRQHTRRHRPGGRRDRRGAHGRLGPSRAAAADGRAGPARSAAAASRHGGGVAQAVGPAVVSVRTDQGLGSGVVYDPSGLILTNAHVVAGAQSITIGMVDGRHFAGKVVGSDTGFDVAVIKIDGTEPAHARRSATPATLQVGDPVIAIGNPFGFDHTLTTGVVSALNRPVSEGQGSYNQPMIQTDAAINPGNSGGPLLDLSGQVMGITTLVAAPEGIPAQGLGFAVPSDTAKRIADQLVQSGKVTHSGQPYLGVSLGDINRPDTTPGFPGQPCCRSARRAGPARRSPRPAAGAATADALPAGSTTARWSATSRPAARRRRPACRPAT